MNKHYYSFGNPFKVKFRKHYCYKCGSKLSIVKHHKIVNQKSEEAKYYDFSAGVDGGIMIGPCDFIHKVFYCQKCHKNIEFVTQISLEDIDILRTKIIKYFYKNGRYINIKKYFENINNEVTEECSVELIKNLCFLIEENDKKPLLYKIPITRKEYWERPYYFKIKKKDLIDYIAKFSEKC